MILIYSQKATALVIFSLFFITLLNGQETSYDSLIIPEPKTFITQHKINVEGALISYKATASETYLKDSKGLPVASIWTMAYTKEGNISASKRPVTFVFNGGPGVASIWLHMGLFGPELVKVDSDAKKDDGAAPYNMTPNTNSLLDITDLVFIDPVGTGFSRVLGKGKEKDYWGLNEDATSIAKFIRLWISKNNRWLSPKYLAGESFGTTRAAAVANTLENDGQNMALNGLILISQALDYAGSTSVNDNITSYLTYLPSMAATAWYHEKAGIGKDLSSFVQEARDFTYDEYAPALLKGNTLEQNETLEIAQRLSYFIGIDEDYILRSNLRILMGRFQRKLLEKEGLSIGRLDGRFMGDEIDKVAETPRLGDPADYQIGAAYTAAFNSYLKTSLKVEMERPYLTSNDEISQKWRWRTAADEEYWEPSAVNVTRRLAETMKRNPEMKVLVANGYYDLICPFFDAEYTFSRNGISSERVKLTYYKAGHMMYVHEPDFIKISKDIREFLTPN